MILPTKKFLLILYSGFILSIIGFFFRELSILQYIFYLLLFLFSIIDFLSIVRRNEIKIKRIHEKYLSIGIDNQIKISIENFSNKKSFFIIRDEYPEEFEVKNDTCNIKLKPLFFGTVSYYVKPLLKGKYNFNNIYIRVSGKFGLIYRQYKISLQTSISVYPNIIELKKFLNLISQNRQEQIGYKMRLPGGETEFDFLRDYQSGDNYKKINWKATAKKRHPIVEIDQKEFNRNILVILDTGRMMTTKYGYLTKLDYAIDTALILAAASIKKNDRFGMLSFSDKINFFFAAFQKQ